MKLKKHTLIILLLFIMLFVCIGSASAVENQTDDISENEVIGVSESPDGGTFNDLQVKIDTASEGTVNLANNYTYDESFSQEGIKITKAITINGNGFTINGLDKARIFNINASENIVLNNITFINGKSDLGGAIIFNTAVSDIVIDNCKFINNSAATNGGAIYAKSTFINSTIKNTEFISNTATKNGGAVYINENASENTFENLTFSYNKAKSADGGAINFHNPLSKTTFKNITFFKNSAGNGGGAINTDQNVNDDNSYINVKFINNTAPNGGAINGYGSSNYNSFDGCVFANNTATSHGGAIYYKATFNYNSFEYCSFINNTAEKNGGVIYLYRASNFNKFNENSFINNTATNNAGVVYYRGSSSSDIYNNTEFINNTALSVDGGCISVYSNLVNITFDNSTFINNKAGGNGGAINVDNAARTNNFINTKFINNTASKNGGAISLVDAADNIWNNTIFTQNKANISGGAIHAFKKMENYNIINSSFIENTAKTNGGAINIPYNSTNSNIADSSFINNTAGIGGAIYYIYSSNDTFFNVNFTNNKATSLNNSHGGGAIYVNGSAINDRFDSLIFNNNTARYGGALYIGQLLRNRFVNIEFINNTAGFNGGAVYIEKAFKHNKFNNTTFKNNKALRNGGAIYTVPSSLVNTFENSTFENNNASEVDGGAINLHTDLLETVFNNVKFISNTAGFNGGAINIDHGSKDNLFNNTSFIDNAATRNGGAIYTRYHSITNTYKNTLFKNNTAINVDGGAINSYGNLLNNTFDNSTFINNTGRNGGAINVDTNAKNNVFINTEFKENTARSNGGAFCVDNTDNNTWNNTRFTGNNANNTGGAIHTNELMQNEKIINSTFTDNFAGINGSALDIKGENINISDSKFINNSANVIVAQVSGLSILNSGFTNNKGYSIDLNNSEALIENSIFNNDAGASIRVLDDSVLYLSKNELSPQEYILDKGIILSETKIVVLNNLTINCNVGEEITLNATIYDDNGNTIIVDDLDFIIESETIDSTLENTTYKSDYTPKLGRHIVSASVDSNLNKYTVDYGLIIAKYNSCVEITQLNNITYGEKLNMEFEFENSTSVLIEVTDENGNVIYNNTTSSNSIILENLSAGIYSITITTQESENYTASSTNATVTVSKMATEITLANETIELKAYKSIGDLATLNPADAGNLTYTSSDEDVVLVSEDGIIFARIKGTATVTVSFAGDDNYKAAESKNITVSVTLNDASVSVENDTIDLNVDDTCIINATSNPSFLTVYYTSSNESVATVTDYGNVKAIGEGTAVITLTVGNGETYAVNSTNVTVTVSKIATAITVDPDSLDLSVGDETVIVAALAPADAGNVTFTSSDENIVTVDGEGNVIAQGKGTAIITVSFAGNNKYATAENKTINVSVKKLNATMDVSAVEITEGENATINVILPSDAIGNVTAAVNGKTYSSEVKDGKAVITIPDLEYGDYTVPVTYSGDDKYNSLTNDVNLTVKKDEIIVSAPDLTKYYSGYEPFIVNITYARGVPVADKDVKITINGVTYSKTTDEKGIALLSINLNSKTYDVTTVVDNITVSSIVTILPTIEAEDIESKSKNIVFTATFLDSEGNYLKSQTNVSFNIGGVIYNSQVSGNKGLASVDLILDRGRYLITSQNTVTYENAVNSIAVDLKDADMILSDDEISVGENATISVTLPSDAAGNVTAKINGKTYISQVKDGKATITIPDLSAGNYTVPVSYSGDYNYNSAAGEANITVNKVNATMTVDAPAITVGENATVTVTLPEDATGNVTIGDEIVPVKDGTASAVLTDLPVGTNTVPVTYLGDDKYNSIEMSADVVVNEKPVPAKENLTIQATAGEIIEGDDAFIIVNGLENATGNVSANIHGKTYTAPISEGKATITVPGLTENATAVINYPGDDKYNPATTSVNITVNKNTVTINAQNLTKYYKDPQKFTVNVTDAKGQAAANKSVEITINGVTYTRTTDENGTASLNINLNSGEYPVSVAVDDVVVNSTVTVKATIDASDIVKVFGNDTQYYATFTDVNGTPVANTTVSFNVNGVIYNRTTDENGTAKLNINLPPGEYILTATNTETGEKMSNVIKVLSFIESADLIKYFRNESQFVVRIHTADGGYVGAGEEVKFNINGMVYSKKTNATGHAKININLPQGLYTITTYYKDFSQGNSIEVLPILSADDLVMKFMDGSQFKAKLVDGQGNPYTNKYVTFNVNGIFYNRLTGDDGVAKLNINLPAGEYIITSSYNGCNIANKITIRG